MAKWRCSVCGYVHAGAEPPSQCPVCGADRSRFTSVEAGDEVARHEVAQRQDASQPEAQRWQCAVCGFIHTGSAPPDVCPVCGAQTGHFASIDAAPAPEGIPQNASTAVAAETKRWQCTICGYIHTGPEPPDTCPVCGADRSKFVRLDEPPKPEVRKTEKPTAFDQPTASETPTPASLLEPYRRWIDLAIKYHAHPIAVHIPNGVLPITVVMVLLSAIFDWPSIGQAGIYNMGFIFLSMPVVLFTGYLHWQFKFGGNMTALFKGKIVCGAIVLVLSMLLFAWGLIAPDAARDPGAFYLLLHIVLLVTAGIAGWLGGKLVFRPKE
jgi:rubrerythrin/uncharacterized membrane protein